MTLTNFDLEHLCNLYKINLIQCCGKDGLIGRPQNGCYIINLNDTADVGSHWTCFYIKDGSCAYWDSFGCICPYNVSRYSVDQIQNIDDNHCGYYCIAFLSYMSNHKGKLSYLLNQFNSIFDLKDTKKNVGILQEYIIHIK
jgi:hypothetical protein